MKKVVLVSLHGKLLFQKMLGILDPVEKRGSIFDNSRRYQKLSKSLVSSYMLINYFSHTLQKGLCAAFAQKNTGVLGVMSILLSTGSGMAGVFWNMILYSQTGCTVSCVVGEITLQQYYMLCYSWLAN